MNARLVLLAVLYATSVSAADPAPNAILGEIRPTKTWNRSEPLGDTPKHVTNAYPLSDQENKAGWEAVASLSDEFEGAELDSNKWALGIPGWKGRQPGLFCDRNVTVSNGKLQLSMKKEKVPPKEEEFGYHDYTSAALHNKTRGHYGYYEVKAKPMNSGGSSSFWFCQDESPDWQTEIDVFEIGGKAKGFERNYHMTLHVWRTPKSTTHWSVPNIWVAPKHLADDYHVYGIDWRKDAIKWYFDGVHVCTVENTHWHQPLRMIFDSETMGEWLGMPDDADLPSTFCVEYVRAWRVAARN